MTNRKLASIQKIIDIQPIPGADAIEVATVLGWHVVVKKGEFKVGDLCIYCETDSILPDRPETQFLAPKFRIRTVRLRGQISQGICFPLSILNLEGGYAIGEGYDATEMLGVKKYEPEVPASLSGEARGMLSDYVPKTDETRLQAVPELLERYKDIPFYVTEKVDGSSTTFFIKDGEFHACGRTVDFKEESNNSIWRAAKGINLPEKLAKYPNIALQGEIVGPKIQDNKLKLENTKLLFFNAFNIETREYLNYTEFIYITNSLGVETVPIIESRFNLLPTVDAMVEFATRKSLINPEVWVEGVVFRPLEEMQDEDLGRLSFKVINPEFLLKNNE